MEQPTAYTQDGEPIYAPADRNDVRFIVAREPEPDDIDHQWHVTVIDDRGRVVERIHTADGYGYVADYREWQARHVEAERLGVHPLEVAWGDEEG